IESRERYMKKLPRLCKHVGQLSASIGQQYCQISRNSKKESKKLKTFQRALVSLQKAYPKFYFKQKVTEEFVHLADEAGHTSAFLKAEMAKHPRDRKKRLQLRSKMRDLEKSIWLSLEEYDQEYQQLK